MRLFKLAVILLLFFSASVFSQEVELEGTFFRSFADTLVARNSLSGQNTFRYIVEILPLNPPSDPLVEVFRVTGGSCPFTHPVGTFPLCQAEPEPLCSDGLNQISINGRPPFCASGGCEELTDFIIDNFAVGGSCTNTNDPFNASTQCDDNGSTICFTADTPSKIPEDISSLDAPDTNGGPLDDPRPDDDIKTTKETTEQGDERRETTTTQRTDPETGDTIIETTVTTTNLTNNNSTTTTTVQTINNQGDTVTNISGSQGTSDQTQEQGDEGSASGGNTCSLRPSCSGDSIQCLVLFQQWSTRCAAEELSDLLVGGDISGGTSCDSPPIRGDNVSDADWIQTLNFFNLNCSGNSDLDFNGGEGFNTSDATDALSLAQNEYTDLITNIRSELDNVLNFNISGSGQLTDDIVNIKGVDISFGIAKFSDQLSIIGAIIIAIAYILGGIIVFRGSTQRG